jgi:hypothetical protein
MEKNEPKKGKKPRENQYLARVRTGKEYQGTMEKITTQMHTDGYQFPKDLVLLELLGGMAL